MEKWTDSEIVYDGQIVQLRVGEVALDDGSKAMREVIEHPGGVAVAPFTGSSVVLVKQYRISVGEYVVELPAGKLEGDEDPEHRGRCELKEETGFKAGRMIYLGHVFSAIGFCSERIHLYLALELEKGEQELEHEERIELVEFSLEEIRQGLRQHSFVDAKTAVGLQALLYHLDG